MNCIAHLLNQMPYTEIQHPMISLPQRERHEDYSRLPVPENMIVAELFC